MASELYKLMNISVIRHQSIALSILRKTSQLQQSSVCVCVCVYLCYFLNVSLQHANSLALKAALHRWWTLVSKVSGTFHFKLFLLSFTFPCCFLSALSASHSTEKPGHKHRAVFSNGLTSRKPKFKGFTWETGKIFILPLALLLGWETAVSSVCYNRGRRSAEAKEVIGLFQ